MKKLLLMAALLCTIVPAAWALDVWDGSVSQPTYDEARGGVVITKGSELAYVHQHWIDEVGGGGAYCTANYFLDDDLDLSAYSWIPMGQGRGALTPFVGTFYGNGHNINLVISDATEDYQGLFAEIRKEGHVRDLHVSGSIQCSDSRLVGGIAGQNDGVISDCWVSANVTSGWSSSSAATAKVAGICGENNGLVEFCCVTGDVQNHDADVGGIVGYNSGSGVINHCTFYGDRNSSHSQDNVFVGDQDGKLWNAHAGDLSDDATLDNYLSSFSDIESCNLYRCAIQYPNPTDIRNEGYGAMESSFPGAREGKTARLTKAFGSLQSLTITDAYGRTITPSGNETDGYTFTMPRLGVFVKPTFSGNHWLAAHAGTASDPYRISSTEDWKAFAYYVRQGYNFYQQYVLLERDITITTTVGLREEGIYGLRPFCGTFLGDGHTLTANLSSTATGTGSNEQGVAPFHCIFGATIKDLTVAGTISSASYHTAGLVGFAYSTNLIEKCNVTATLNISSDYAGGIVGHGENSATTIKDCVFAGTINGVGGERANVGAIWGWSDSGTPVFQNCLERGTYKGISSMHPLGLHGAAGSITDCYYLNAQIGTPALVSTVSGAYQVQTSIPENEVYRTVTVGDATPYYLTCAVSGVNSNYTITESSVEPNVTVTCKGTTLVESTDYAVAYANNRQTGNASVVINGQGSYQGRKTVPFTISAPDIIDGAWSMLVADYNLLDGHTYKVEGNVELEDNRVFIEGDVVLYLSAGSTLKCYYGIEVGEGKTLTIEGPGSLVVEHSTHEGAGIGAQKMGTLIINGGNIDVQGGTYAAGIGGNRNSLGTGRIIINGGVVKAHGGWGGAGIGGGDKSMEGDYGRCNDIVINGGQVTAIGGEYAPAIGHGNESGNSGTLTIGWTNPDDYLHLQGGNGLGSVTFADGKQFMYDGTTTIATASDISSKKIVPYMPVEGIAGSGTETDPYTIGSTEEWNRFAKSVTFGNSYSGKYVKLKADITVTQQCGYVTGGTPSKAFSGTFLGDYHTITADISDNRHQGTALFSYIKNATIERLTVAGTITSANPYTGGLVGFADGTNTIEGCVVKAALNIRSDYAGGIVGNGLSSATSVFDCLFAGTVTGIAGNRGNVGGIYGWCNDGGKPTLEYCMEKGTYTNLSSMHPMGLQGNRGTMSQCYYLNPMRGTPANACTLSGAYQASLTLIDGEICEYVDVLDGSMYYVPCVIGGVEEFYELAEDSTLSITPTVARSDGRLLGNYDYKITLDDEEIGSTATVASKGQHTLVITGKIPSCFGSKSFTFQVFDPIAGTGTEEDPYLIRNVDEWNLFATLVNRGADGNDFSGKFVKLNTDLTVTTMVGASADKAFKGTFLGGGNTLTFNGGTASKPFGEEFCAPFRYVSDATIKDLKVAGDIYTYKMRSAGLVGLTAGSTTITGCQVSTVIHSSTPGDGSHGGIVGMPSGALTITDCIYSGRLLTTNGTMHCGGFVGWHNGQNISITSSLYAPVTVLGGSAANTAPGGSAAATVLGGSAAETPVTVGATFVRGTNVGTDCFYTQRLGDAQGTMVYTEPVAGELCMKAQAADNNWYYLPVTVGDIKTVYMLEGESLSINPSIKGYGEINPTQTTDYTATLNGETVALPCTVNQKGDYKLVFTAVEGSETCSGSKTIEFSVSNQFEGTGTEENPYLIGSTEDWKLFADRVAEGETYEGKFLKLNANISVSTMVGTNAAHSFSGTFSGSDDYTLTFTGGTVEAPIAEEFCAPFRYVNGATIQHLQVAGHIYTSGKFAAGLVGSPSGSSTIKDCQVGTVIHSSISGEGSHGGIVAMLSGALTIENCVYDGQLLTTGGTTSCGGFVGWANSQTVNVTNSLYAPATVLGGSAATVLGGSAAATVLGGSAAATVLGGSAAETPITLGATFVRGGSVGNYCYYTAPLGEPQGTMVYATRPEGELCMQAQAADKKMYYLPCTVGGVLAAYAQEDEIGITPTVTGLDNAALTFTTDFTATLDGNTVESLPVSTTGKGSHTLVLTGKGDNYSGSKTIQFTVTAALAGNGTEATPYLIGSTDDWALFATKVAGGLDYSGKYVRLENDITVTVPVGSAPDSTSGGCFSGIFLGGGHTLTVDISNTDADAQGTAPFCYINNATIKNVNVNGTIASNSRYTGGLVGFADGTNVIEQCVVTAKLSVGSDYAAGIVGNGQNSATTISNCIFAGIISGGGGNRGNMAGIWGLGGTPTLSNCLERGTYINVSSLHPIGLQAAAGSISDCYYLNAQKGMPDHACTVGGAWLVSVTSPKGEISKSVTAADGTTYYMLCTVSGVKREYSKSDEAITLNPTVTAADGTTLTAETDFTYATNPATVKDKGSYTLTITAQGNYTGQKAIPFTVSDNVAVTSDMTNMNSGEYTVYENVTIAERITINGDVVLNLSGGTTLNAQKGIELSKGNKLTINGPGQLEINECAEDKSGIGAVEVGTLIINGGKIDVLSGRFAAAIGGDKNNISGGSITINGGKVLAFHSGLAFAPAIGGGYDDQEGHYGVCGDIVINGGQVKASSFAYGFGQGLKPNEKTVTENDFTSGTLTLGWTNQDDYVHDCSFRSSITKSSNVKSITFAEGRKFLLKGTMTVGTPDNLWGQTITPLLAPTDNGDNSSLISACNGMKVPVMLDGRTLYKDGSWNTICLPFDVTISGSPLDGAIARQLETASIDGTTLNLTFSDAVTTLQAGTPYIIKWAKPDGYDEAGSDTLDIKNPVFGNVTIDATDRSYDNNGGDARVRFLGTYNSTDYDGTDKSILLMGGANMLYYPIKGASIGAQRAYFRIGDDAASQADARVMSFNICFDGADNTFGVIDVEKSGVRGNGSDEWYTLDGRRLEDKPTQSGVYVSKGAKRVIK